MSRPLRLGGAALVVSASVLLSRLLGLGREVLLATLIGVNAEGDLYRQAFTIPDFLNYLLAGAYLTITLIPILSRHLERGDTEAASRSFTAVFRLVGLGVVLVTALMWLFADALVSLVFPEVIEHHDRLVGLTRLVLPAQVFLVVGALLIAVQYTHRRFVLPALAPVIYNLGIIVGGLLGAAAGDPSPEAFLWGAVIGSAVGNFGLQWFGARKTRTWFRPVTWREPAVWEYLTLAFPLMIAQSIAVLDEQFVRFFGQTDPGATTALSFARQLNMVPVGIVAQAAGVAAYPFLARLAARGDDTGLARTTSRATRGTVFVSFLAAAGVVAIAAPLVRVLFLYGEFTAADAELVAALLAIYALSIPAWGLHQIMARQFYARRKMWTPVVIGTAFTVLAIPTWLLARDQYGTRGMAMASSALMTAYAVTMLIVWWRDGGGVEAAGLVRSMGRALIAGTVAGMTGRAVVTAVAGDSFSAGSDLVAILAGSLTVVAAFMILTVALRSTEWAELRDRAPVRDDQD
jgi:putative peptidoglycan lipid II flippase